MKIPRNPNKKPCIARNITLFKKMTFYSDSDRKKDMEEIMLFIKILKIKRKYEDSMQYMKYMLFKKRSDKNEAN